MGKKYVKVILLIMFFFLVLSVISYAGGDITGVSDVINAMSGTSNSASSDNAFGKILNTMIGLLQVAGTGISIITVSVLGIKYLLASPSEKADTKKAILPIVIGCVLLFGAVNIISAVYDYAQRAFSTSSN